MESLGAQNRQLDNLLVRLTRADDAAAALDEPSAPRTLPASPDGLEKLPPETRASVLYRHLRDIRATGVGPRVRLERMASLGPLIADTANALTAQSVTATDRRIAISMPIALLKCRYDIKRQALVLSLRESHGDTALVTDSLLATFSGLFDLLTCYWLQHLPPPERLWGELHALYLLSHQVGAGAGSPPTTAVLREVRNAYLKPLLLGTLNPSRFNVGEIRQLIGFVSDHVSHARLGGGHGLFSVDPRCDRPPIYAVRDRDRERSVSLCTKNLVGMLDTARLTARLREDMRRYWSSEQIRSEYHQRTDERVELVFGLEAAHQLFTGCVDDDDFLSHLGARDAGQRLIAQAPIELHSATCIDRSPSGVRLQLTGAPESLGPGELVALLHNGAPQCRLGIIRWTQLTPSLDSVAGIQWLPDPGRPCGTAAVTGKSATPYFRSFLVPGAAHGAWDLLAPSGILKVGGLLHLMDHAGEMDLSITAVADTTPQISRFHTAPADLGCVAATAPVIQAPAIRQAHAGHGSARTASAI